MACSKISKFEDVYISSIYNTSKAFRNAILTNRITKLRDSDMFRLSVDT